MAIRKKKKKTEKRLITFDNEILRKIYSSMFDTEKNEWRTRRKLRKETTGCRKSKKLCKPYRLNLIVQCERKRRQINGDKSLESKCEVTKRHLRSEEKVKEDMEYYVTQQIEKITNSSFFCNIVKGSS